MQSTNYGDRVRVVHATADGNVLLVQQAGVEGWETVHAFPELGDVYAAAKADAAGQHLQQMWRHFPAERVEQLRAAVRGTLALPEVRAAVAALRSTIEDRTPTTSNSGTGAAA
jgi:hypothetical protein